MANDLFNKDKQKLKYVTGKYKSLKDFADKEKLSYEYLRGYAKGWNKDKKEYQQQIIDKSITEMQKKEISRELKANERHIELWDKVLDILENSMISSKNLSNFKGKDNLHNAIKSLTYSLEKAQKGQRIAYGMDESDKNDIEEKLADTFEKMQEAFSGESMEDE